MCRAPRVRYEADSEHAAPTLESLTIQLCFCKESSEILITADQHDDEVQISIRDNGMGMASEHLTILDSGMPRRRNKAKRKSTGFGVPIARRYIEAHSGTLTFRAFANFNSKLFQVNYCFLLLMPFSLAIAKTLSGPSI